MFFFSKSLVATALLAVSLSLEVSAHAIISPALGVNGTPSRNNVQRPSTASPCGNVNIASTFDSTQAIAASGTTFTATVTNFNAGTDGSRQVTAKVDATGTGKSFVNAQVTVNGDKSPTNVGSQQVTVQLPAGTACTGGATGNKCLVSFTTAGGFGNCVAVSQGAAAAAGNAAAGTAAAGTAATGTAATGTTGTTGTGKTGKGRGKKAAAAAAAAQAAANKKAAAAAAAQAQAKAQAAAAVKQGKIAKFVEEQRKASRAVGTRAAAIARRAAERPAVEVLA